MILFDKIPFVDVWMFDATGIAIVIGGSLIIGIIIGLVLGD